MSTNWNMDCTGGTGTAAVFVVQVNVYVDDELVATRTHTPVEGDTAPWSFSVPLDLDGTHTVTVTDIAANGPTEYRAYESTLVCSAATTTTAPATTTTAPVASVTAASIPATVPIPSTLPVPPTISVAIASTVGVATTAPFTTATALAETITAAPATLPATGAATGAMVDVGLGFILAGAVALFAARRSFRPRWR